MTIEAIREVQSMGGGSLSINTIITYYEYYMKFQAYVLMGNGKMDAYTFAACDCGITERSIMRAVQTIEQIIHTAKNTTP